MGIADDPDVDDYYTKACGFPITYFPDDNPEVIEEMCISVAKLKHGDDVNEREGSNKESSSDDETTSEEDTESGAEEDWVNEDISEAVGGGQPEQQKKKQKTLTSVDKVHHL